MNTISQILLVASVIVVVLGSIAIIILISNIKMLKIMKNINKFIENENSFINLEPKKISKGYLILKEVLDIPLGFIMFVLMSPIILIIAILIKLEDGGPILTQRKRVGKDGMLINLNYFRVEKREIQSNLDLSEKDFTRIGLFLRKTEIEALPLLINVIKGDIAITGPSFYSPKMYEELPNSFKQKLSIYKPGMTSLWAISLDRRSYSRESKILFDIYYVTNKSFLLDLYISYYTVIIVFANNGNI